MVLMYKRLMHIFRAILFHHFCEINFFLWSLLFHVVSSVTLVHTINPNTVFLLQNMLHFIYISYTCLTLKSTYAEK